jgi:hypothetical protein
MKTWLRGNRWEVQPGQTLGRFPIHSDKFDENELILPLHLTSEGFPSVWGPAHAFATRLNHSLLRLDHVEEAYRKQCRQAALDLLHLVVAQFLGLLKPEEVPLDGGQGELASSRLARLLRESLAAESRPLSSLVFLRDPRLSGSIAAINYPDCLWFPVHSYPLDLVSGRIREILGTVSLEGLEPSPDLPEDDVAALVGQLRGYLRHLTASTQDDLPSRRVLARFERGLESRAQPIEVPIRSGRVFSLHDRKPRAVDLLRSGAVGTPVGAGCPTCGLDWMNYPYKQGRHILQGGNPPQRKVYCPRHEKQEIAGWDDLKELGVFFDESDSEYIIWADDPTDPGARELQIPPNGERTSVQRDSQTLQGYARFRFNNAEIEVRGRVLKRSEVLLRQVVERPPNSTTDILPINGEEAVCIDWDNGGVARDPSRRDYWSIRLRGGWRPFVWQADSIKDADLSSQNNVTLLLWPGFEDPTWTAETVVYGLARLSPARSRPPKVRCYGKGPRRDRILAVHQGEDIRSMLHLPKRVEAIELRSPDDEPMGYILPKRRTIQPAQVRDAEVALDFGTSNTVVAWKPSHGRANAVAMDQNATPLELMAPADAQERDRMAKTLNLLPFWPKQVAERWCIPSELLYFPESDQWTIPHDAIEPALLESKDIRRDFKWRDEENIHRRTYLSLILRMALANLRAQGIRSARLRATYPLAFERGHLTGYAKVLQELVGKLNTETGLELSLSGYANESISGLEACGQKAGNLQCVIDFGGGTTDIAVRILDLSSKGFVDPLFVDSIRLAGNDVLDSLLADPDLLDGLLRHGKVGLSNAKPEVRLKVARQIVLRELRLAGRALPDWWRYLIDQQSGPAQRFGVRNRAFFDGVLAYVLKLMSVAQQKMRRDGVLAEDEEANIAVFLLGQGWGLLRLQVEKGDYDPRVYVQRRLEELRSRLPFASSIKGRFQIIVPDYQVSASPKLATSVGAVDLRPDHVRPAETLEDKTAGRDTVFGLNVEFYDRKSRLSADDPLSVDRPEIPSAVSKHDAWDQFVAPLLNAPGISNHVRQLFGPNDADRQTYVENRLTDLIDKEMGVPLGKGEMLRTSPLLLLIERVWTEQLKHVNS